MSSKSLEIDVSVSFPGFSLEVAETLPLDGATALYGPSGSGKSTLLRLIAGFLAPDRGRIALDGTVLTNIGEGLHLPAHKRRVGTVFQEGRLFPHLSVLQNLHYAERRCPDEEKSFPFEEVVDAFDLGVLFERRPASLSGGEAQRAALARTLLTRPKLLLLDEPLSALDGARKTEIFPYLEALQARFGIPVLYVSHDAGEILRMTGHALILEAGRLHSSGPTAEVLGAYGLHAGIGTPAAGAILSGQIASHDEEFLLTHIAVGDGMLSLPINRQKAPGDTVHLRIDPRNVTLATEPPDSISIRNILPAKVTDIIEQPDTPFADIMLEVSGMALRAQITRAARADLSLSPGMAVHALIKTASFEPSEA